VVEAAEQDVQVCDAAITLAFSILGKRWNGMIVGTLGSGALSFVALRRAVVGHSQGVLSGRRCEHADSDHVVRQVEPGPPVSVSYALTPRGQRLVPLLEQLGQWASENLTIQHPA
jgi:DNA-binding HxlR family transcriptional regulator